MITKQERMAVLENQIERLQRRLNRLDARSNRYSWIRLTIFIAALFLCTLTFIFLKGWWDIVSILLGIAVFTLAAYVHRQVDRAFIRHKIWLQIKTAHVARMRLDWANIPDAGQFPARENHPFEVDLDISGARSIHQLVNTAVSYEGRQRLSEWLLNTQPDLKVIQQRQQLVQELAPMTRFRDKLCMKSLLASSFVLEHLEGKRLLVWLKEHRGRKPAVLSLVVSIALSLATISLIVLNLFALLGPQYWILSLLLSLIWFYARIKERGDLFEDAYYLRDGFGQLSSVFAYLETYRYGNNQHVKKLCEPFFKNQRQRPSQLLKGLSRAASAATLEKNQLLWLVVNLFVPWDIIVSYRLNHYKALIEAVLPGWLDTWFELEALASLANFAYLNPQYTMPTVEETRGQALLFQAQGLGHPLIEDEKKVVNDFALTTKGEIVIITGSNMSGKSTFLRTIGVNLCLAYAGGPVNAQAFQTGLFRLFTCIRVSDSVTDGYSYFYAEVRRLKALLTELQQPSDLPLFFLIDEIFKGTNNRERLIGSRAYIQALVGQNCVGMISTHDLELIHLADTIPLIQNYHFKEDVVDGQMVFDYMLRPGPCPTTNALKIMQMEGLPVEAN